MSLEPEVTNVLEENGTLQFQLSCVNTSIANAIRRTILSDIKTTVIDSNVYDNELCNIEINTTMLTNEIIKQRLNQIPVHDPELKLVGNFSLSVNVKNDTPDVTFVTTEDFMVIDKKTGKPVSPEMRERIFPKNEITQDYILVCKLRPKISDSMQLNQLKLMAEFSVGYAKKNASFNVASKSTYGFTKDMVAVKDEWEKRKMLLSNDNRSADEIKFEERNFMLLDAQRYYVPNSFEFAVATVGVYTNKELVAKSTTVVHDKFVDFIDAINANAVPIVESSASKDYSALENSYDITLINEDYTIGHILDNILYTEFYVANPVASYVGFKKMHPHDANSVLRIAFHKKTDEHDVRNKLIHASSIACKILETIHKKFK